MNLLHSPLALRSVRLPNRIVLSPMAQYAAPDGVPGRWHLVHLGSRALGGAGTVMVEATAVSPEGRLSLMDTGLWSDRQIDAYRPLVDLIVEHGAVPALQLAHAGRKASVGVPWESPGPLDSARGAWTVLAPSPIPYGDGYPVPREMDEADIDQLVDDFAAAARRAAAAGFRLLECHMAHGYLMHQFLSPLSNRRQDAFGGDRVARMAVPLRVARAVRQAWPDSLPLAVRISAVDALDGGWAIDDSIAFSRELAEAGVDLIDCSSGALTPAGRLPAGPGYQVPFARAIRQAVGVATAAVGAITEAGQAEAILQRQEADLICVGRAFVDDPYWGLHAARALGLDVWPPQYARAVRPLGSARAG
ncbi:MAG: NADH:flavin oxidoreductase/NADH oxidase [Burkholderiaceae bacterium]